LQNSISVRTICLFSWRPGLGSAMARSRAVAAVAALLIATRGPQGIPGERAEVIRIWGCGRGQSFSGSALADVLRTLGVDVEVRKYSTTVKGKRYGRCLLVIRDRKLISRIRRAARKGKLVGMIRWWWEAVAKALAAAKLRRWRDLAAMLPESVLKRIAGVKPFNRKFYLAWRHRDVVKRLRPVGWRTYFFFKKLKGYLYRAAFDAHWDRDIGIFYRAVDEAAEKLARSTRYWNVDLARRRLLEYMGYGPAYIVFLRRQGVIPRPEDVEKYWERYAWERLEKRLGKNRPWF